METMTNGRGREAVARHAAWTHAFARRLVGRHALAADLAQEALLAYMERPPRDARSPRAWLGAVVRHKFANHCRADRRRRRQEAARGHRQQARPESVSGASERRELRGRVWSEIRQLDEPYRSSVILAFYQERALRTVALFSGVPYETARARLRRALDQLRSRL